MKKTLLILGMLLVLLAPASLPAEETAVVNPLLMGAVQFGEHSARTELIWKSGRIEDIDETGMRVADLGYRFVSETKFYSASGQSLSWQNFNAGTSVKFVIRREPKTGYLITVISLIKER
jgi:hypothetical protein